MPSSFWYLEPYGKYLKATNHLDVPKMGQPQSLPKAKANPDAADDLTGETPLMEVGWCQVVCFLLSFPKRGKTSIPID